LCHYKTLKKPANRELVCQITDSTCHFPQGQQGQLNLKSLLKKATVASHKIDPEQRYSLCFLSPDPKHVVRCPGNRAEHRGTSSPLMQGTDCKEKEGTNDGRVRHSELARSLYQMQLLWIRRTSKIKFFHQQASENPVPNNTLSRSIEAFPFN